MRQIFLFSVLLALFGSCLKKKVSLPMESEQVKQGLHAKSLKAPEETEVLAATKPQEKVETPSLVENSSSLISGTVIATRQGAIGFRVAGHIKRSLVRNGDKVKAGQILAVLDDTDLKLAQRMAKNGLNQAQVLMAQAERDDSREEGLQRAKATSQSRLERAEDAFEMAKLGESQAEIAYSQATQRVKDAQLQAPYDAIILKRMKTEGEFVGVGAPVFEMVGTQNLEFSLRVPENLLQKSKVGEVVQYAIPSLGVTGKMTLTRVVPIISETSRTFEVIGVDKQKNENVAPGQFVEVNL